MLSAWIVPAETAVVIDTSMMNQLSAERDITIRKGLVESASIRITLRIPLKSINKLAMNHIRLNYMMADFLHKTEISQGSVMVPTCNFDKVLAIKSSGFISRSISLKVTSKITLSSDASIDMRLVSVAFDPRYTN